MALAHNVFYHPLPVFCSTKHSPSPKTQPRTSCRHTAIKTTQTHSKKHHYTPTFTQNKHLSPQTRTKVITLLIYTAFKLQQGLQPRLSNSKTQTPVTSLPSPYYHTLSRECTLIFPADWLLERQFHIQRSPRTPCWTSSPTMLQANKLITLKNIFQTKPTFVFMLYKHRAYFPLKQFHSHCLNACPHKMLASDPLSGI